MEEPVNEPIDEIRASQPEEAAEAEAEEVTTIGFEEQVSGEMVTFSKGVAGAVSAQQDVTIIQGGAGAIGAGEDANITYGGAAVIGVGGDMEIVNGGGMFVNTGGDTNLTNGGALSVMSGGNVTLRNAGAGIVFAQEMHLEEGSRVMLDMKGAIAFGAAMGAVAAVLGWILRRR